MSELSMHDKKNWRWPKRRSSQKGVTVIELLISCVVLIVGLLAIMALFLIAIGNNGRSKVDSSATMLTQSVLEQISAALTRGGSAVVQDCAGDTWIMSTAGSNAAGGMGSKLDSANITIDYSETTPPAGYHMDYVICSGATQRAYDVRWNIRDMTAGGTSLITVAARPKNLGQARFAFGLPVNMRVYIGRGQ